MGEVTPDRQGFVAEWSVPLSEGRTFVTPQVTEISTRHGYSKTTINDLICNVRTIRALEEVGVELVVDSYRGKKIYRDDQVPLEETDIENTKQRIDEQMAASIAKMKQTRYSAN